MEDANQQRRYPSAMAASMSQVLEDEDMLGEILLRLVFATSLVRAAAVCRRWLRAASSPGFLRRFRDLHPPRLLGFYANTNSLGSPMFVPTSQTSAEPELAAAVRLAGSSIHVGWPSSILDCQNGRLLVQLNNKDRVTSMLSPLHPARDTVTLPQPPITNYFFQTMFMNTEAVAFTTTWELEHHHPQQIIAHVHELQDDTWHNLTLPAMQLPLLVHPLSVTHRPVNGKLYIVVSSASDAATLALKLSDLSYVSIIAPPEGAEGSNVQAWTDDSGVYLIHVKDFQLRFWVYKVDTQNWLLQETICLHDVCAKPGVVTELTSQSQWGLSDSTAVRIPEVGQSAEFVFLQVGLDVLYIHIKSRTVEKVYSATPKEYESWINLIPFVMVWPPIFPVSKEDSTQDKY